MNKPFSSNYFGNHVTKTRFLTGSVIFDLLVMTTFKWARLKAAEFGGHSSNCFEVIQILSEGIFTKSQSFDLRLQARLSFDARWDFLTSWKLLSTAWNHYSSTEVKLFSNSFENRIHALHRQSKKKSWTLNVKIYSTWNSLQVQCVLQIIALTGV